jgi:hypothetical protein
MDVIPVELLDMIAKSADTRSVGKLGCVSRRFRDVVRSLEDGDYWKQKYHELSAFYTRMYEFTKHLPERPGLPNWYRQACMLLEDLEHVSAVNTYRCRIGRELKLELSKHTGIFKTDGDQPRKLDIAVPLLYRINVWPQDNNPDTSRWIAIDDLYGDYECRFTTELEKALYNAYFPSVVYSRRCWYRLRVFERIGETTAFFCDMELVDSFKHPPASLGIGSFVVDDPTGTLSRIQKEPREREFALLMRIALHFRLWVEAPDPVFRPDSHVRSLHALNLGWAPVRRLVQ